ncbi:MAG: ArnT family glycosyltransferase [Thermoleophilia bacterium]
MKTGFLKRYELVLLVGLMLVVTVPFIGQAVQHDAHQFIDFAKMELDHPLWQHLQDYDYFGVHYHGSDYHDTHPRLQSLYLSLWLRVDHVNLAPWALHLEMLIFPLIAVVAMYFLARRFKVNAFIATLLMVVAPAFLVANHLIMIDVPGVAFWLAAMVFFIKGVDDDRVAYLLAGALCLSLAVFTYYQDLSLLPLIFLYMLLKRKVNARTVTALAIPVMLFLAFVAAHFAYYGQPPNFTYTFGQPMDLHSIIVRIRGTIALLGGVLLFPMAAIAIYSRIRWINFVALAVLVVTIIWSAIYYLQGMFVADDLLLLPWLMAGGVMMLLFILRKLANAAPLTLVQAGGTDDVILAVWFLGIFFYNCILLPYPSSRYLIPLIPPAAIFATREIQRMWGSDRRQLVVATGIIAGTTLALALAVAIGENERANMNPVEAGWAAVHYPPDGHVWFNGGLGFQYYMQQKGYPMALIDGDGVKKGDYIVESINNRWYFSGDFIYRLELVQTVDFPRSWPVATEYHTAGTSWLGIIGMDTPYGFTGAYQDRLYIYKVIASPEEEQLCRLRPPAAE